MSSEFMLETPTLDEPYRSLTMRIVRSARRMNEMVRDLLDFTRGRLGSGVPVTRAAMDLASVVRQAAEEVTATRPDRVIAVDTAGDLHGAWDAARTSQVLTNLVGNAVQHGAAQTPVRVTARGEPGAVVLQIHNRGLAIPATELPGLFSPLKRLRVGEKSAARHDGSLGLGLYIAERIVTAHGGAIAVTSSADAGTTFTVRLPR